MGEDVFVAGAVRAENFLPLLLPGLIEQCDVFLAAIEVQAANGFVVVFIEVTGKFLS
jgi:hypothetical protein